MIQYSSSLCQYRLSILCSQYLSLELLGNACEPLHAISPVLQLTLRPIIATPFPVVVQTAPSQEVMRVKQHPPKKPAARESNVPAEETHRARKTSRRQHHQILDNTQFLRCTTSYLRHTRYHQVSSKHRKQSIS